MKTYIVYDPTGNEIVGVYIYARTQNDAERQAVVRYGPRSSVAYTEL